MKAISRRLLANGTLLALLLVGGCTQMPTEKTAVLDMRPQISFTPATDATLAGRVSVDGLDVGTVADFITGNAALRVLPGNHRVRVTSGDAVLVDDRVYLGDGVSRAFLVK